MSVVANVLLWQWEAITIACLPLLEASIGDSVKMSALALNFGIHGTCIFTTIPLFILRLLACFIPRFLFFHFYMTTKDLFVVQYFRTVDADQRISSRRMWHILLAAVFSLTAMNEMLSMYLAGAGPVFSLASFIFSSRAMLCAWLAYSFFKLKRIHEQQAQPEPQQKFEDSLPKYLSPPLGSSSFSPFSFSSPLLTHYL